MHYECRSADPPSEIQSQLHLKEALARLQLAAQELPDARVSDVTPWITMTVSKLFLVLYVTQRQQALPRVVRHTSSRTVHWEEAKGGAENHCELPHTLSVG